MSRSTPNPARVRLSVESLDSRELPSVSLTSSLWTRTLSQTTIQVSYGSQTTWTSGYSSGSSSIIGILIAL